ncbi:prepilin-type N-terminal cleavage/methylation domain-containing protein [bacterium]|jgi:prepilin-type N-terminal cleavage/methylation domain-containing protein|nr:prepilin-type N-terminal cleavage/methylation domain-containing protein [bacterium]
MSQRLNQKGFTLIELMIVISIIGVLAAIAIPNFRQARKMANQRSCYANQKTILGALEMYNLDTGKASVISGNTELDQLKNEKFLQSRPTDPGCAESANYRSDDVGNVWCLMHGNIEGEEAVIDGGDLDATTASLTGDGACP